MHEEVKKHYQELARRSWESRKSEKEIARLKSISKKSWEGISKEERSKIMSERRLMGIKRGAGGRIGTGKK